MSVAPSNPRISRLLEVVTRAEVLVLLVAGGGLFFFPTALRAIWPWSLPPFNAAYLGAVYLASMTAAALLVRSGRWSPARVVVPMILIFTAVVLAVSLAHLDRFDRQSPSTWLWLALYAVIPANAGYHVWRYRGLPPAGAVRLAPAWRAAVAVQAVVLGVYGAGLLVAPAPAAAWWPWPVDAFHARLYSAVFFAPALGALLLVRTAAPEEARALGLAQAVLGAMPAIGLVAVDSALRRVDWTAGGTWLWLGLHLVLAAVGVALVASTRPSRGPARWRRPARWQLAPQSVAALLGGAFVVAGVAGFLPALTPAAPASAPHLVVDHGYGYLLGLFPVNLVHSLFHATVGSVALLACLRPETARRFVRALAVLLGGLTVAGAIPETHTLVGLVPLFGHNVWLHGAEAVVAGYVGFLVPARPDQRDRADRPDPRPLDGGPAHPRLRFNGGRVDRIEG